MQSERIYLVWAHPRHDSLTANIADAIHQRAMERKIQVTELDLYRRNFNPVMTGNDSNLLIVFYVQIMPDDFV
ncbi:NAD(P)H-dependent oxidoreductase, partial [Escherichia coli]|uniref:NAD(P)H-dependent oxidoreductase n=1 Tax=Escherichia coli TaxID=562 RepID=UPI003FD489C1